MGGDQLVGTTSDSFEYDSIGNPTRYGYMDGSSPFLWDSGVEMTWEGRQMQTFRRFYTHYDVETELVYYNQLAFTYNADGIRTSKTVDGVKHTYVLEGSQILAETWEKNGVQYYLVYLYDESGAPIGMKYRTSAYAEDVFDCFFFEKNLQGDIIAVYNSSGTPICTYKYDAWGAFTTTVTSGVTSLERSVANTYNPFRYRGYFYDVESGYYYLQSRYYNPNWGRFLNADGYVSTGTGILGYNMYAYCNNNPVLFVDKTGEGPIGAILLIIGLTVLLTGCNQRVYVDDDYETEDPNSLVGTPADPKSKYRFDTYEEAIMDAAERLAQKTTATGIEYGTTIFQYEDDPYYYHNGTGTSGSYHYFQYSFEANQIPIAIMHSHANANIIDPFGADILPVENDIRIDSFVVVPKDIIFPRQSTNRIYLLSKDAPSIADFIIYAP